MLRTQVKKVALVLGMHRSGTSALTRSINLLGFGAPKTLIKANSTNEKGHWESRRVARLNDRILEAADLAWTDWHRGYLDDIPTEKLHFFRDDIIKTLNSEFKGHQNVVLKDPRICRLAPIYLDALQQFDIEVYPILAFRNPLEVAASLNKRNNIATHDAVLLWLRYTLDAEAATRELKRAFVQYPSFISDSTAYISRIGEQLSLDWPVDPKDAQQQIDAHLDQSLKHHGFSAADTIHDETTHGWASDTYAALELLQHNPKATQALKTLKDIYANFNGAETALRAMVSNQNAIYTRDMDALGAELSQIKSKYDEAQLGREKLKAEKLDRDILIDKLKTTKEEQSVLIEKLRTDKTDSHALIEELKKQTVDQSDTLEQLKSERDSSESETHNLREDLNQKERVIDELNAEKAELDAAIETLQDQKAERDAAIETLQDQKAERDAAIETLQDEKVDHDLIIEALREEQSVRDRIIDELNQQVTDHNLVIDALNKEKSERDFVIEALEHDKAELSQTLMDLNQDIEDHKRHIVTLQTTESGLKNTCENLETQLAERESLISKLQSDKAGYLNTIDALRLETDDIKSSLDTLKRKFSKQSDEASNERQSLSKQISSAHSIVTKLDRQKLDLTEQNDQATTEIKGLQKDVRKSKREIADVLARLKTREKELRQLQRQHWRLKDELAWQKDVLRETHASASWRITAPLRKIKTALRPNPVSETPSIGEPAVRQEQVQGAPITATHAPEIAAPAETTKSPAKASAYVLDKKEIRALQNSELFDAAYYLANYPEAQTHSQGAVGHYIESGWKKGYDPSRLFVTNAWLASNPKLKKGKTSALYDFIKRQTDNEKLQPSHAAHTGRIAVFGAVVDGYDDLKDPTIENDNVDYFIFTNGDVPAYSRWQKRELEYVSHDPTRTARFVKTHPHLWFSDYDWAIWIDANLQLVADPTAIIASLPADTQLATWHHPLRDCVYVEAEECIKRKKDESGAISKLVEHLEASNYPKQAGMLETSVFVSRMKDKAVEAFMNDWWALIEQYSRRDQLALPPTLKRHDLHVSHLAPQGVCMRTDPRFIYHRHNQR